ncbi:hypothetical protein ACFY5C_33820 [Streptomyces sp. NPDC012935]|uniref:hypothetical protein n=1 Tax=Streptomyces sp. NPDC012935 TaxID=3364857 RepID=UPI00369AA411
MVLDDLRPRLEAHEPLVLLRMCLPLGQLVQPVEVLVRAERGVEPGRQVRRRHQLRRLDARECALAGVHDARELREREACTLAVTALLGAEVVAGREIRVRACGSNVIGLASAS